MGQTEEALNQFLKIIQDYPKYSGPYANLGLIYEALGQKDKATEAFDNALALMPRSATIYNSAGLHYRTVGRFNDAESAYLNAIRIASDYPDPILNLAILYDLYLNEPDKAIIYYKLYNSKSNDDNQNVVGWLNDLEQRSNTLNSTNE